MSTQLKNLMLKEEVLAAVKQKGGALEHAADEFKADIEVVLAAEQNN